MALPGFRDFYPDECAFRSHLFAGWRIVAHRYGFVEYDGPPLEPLDLFTKKSGEEIVGQLYNFVDKGERAVALRPEMTPTLARLVAARHRDYKKPLKWFAIPQVFRYERQQKGRLREHYQLNCDIIGEAGREADAELIALVIDVLRHFGLTEKDFVVRLSDRQFWINFLEQNQIAPEQHAAVLQAVDKSERESQEKTAEKLDLIQPGLGEKVLALLQPGRLVDWEPLAQIEVNLTARGLAGYVRRDLTIVRGLAYYTGVVWEVFDRAGEFRAIAGGGRYDSLLKNLGEVDLPALGFGLGDVVLGEMLKARGLVTPVAHLDVYVALADEAFRPHLLELVQQLRDADFATDYALKAQKLNKQLEAATDRNATHIVVVDAQLAQGQVQVKNSATREARMIARAELIDFLRSKL